MPTASTSYNIAVKVTGGTAAVGYVNITNGRTGETLHVKTNTKYEAIGNLLDLPDDFQNGDVIEISVSGNRTGSTTHTVDTSTKGGAKIKISCTDASTTNAPAVTIG